MLSEGIPLSNTYTRATPHAISAVTKQYARIPPFFIHTFAMVQIENAIASGSPPLIPTLSRGLAEQ